MINRERVEELVRELGMVKYNFTSEEELQSGLALRLTQMGQDYIREHQLNPKDRIDFFLVGGIGIEVKIKDGLSALTRQLHRYTQLEDIEALILVTSKNRLTNIPSEMNEKPLYVVNLMSSKF